MGKNIYFIIAFLIPNFNGKFYITSTKKRANETSARLYTTKKLYPQRRQYDSRIICLRLKLFVERTIYPSRESHPIATRHLLPRLLFITGFYRHASTTMPKNDPPHNLSPSSLLVWLHNIKQLKIF